MAKEIYRLPGGRRERRRTQTWIYLGQGLGLLLGAFWASEWTGFRLAHASELGDPVRILQGEESRWAELLAVPPAAYGAWAFGVRRSLVAASLWALAVTLWWIGRKPIYWPWAVLSWWQAGERIPWDAAAAFALGYAAIALPVWKAARSRLESLPRRGDSFGSAHFATEAEVSETGYLEGDGGVVLGYHRGRALRCHKDEHVLVFSPPSTGKSTALAVPTLLSWAGSVVVFDAKGELFELTAGYRSETMGQEVLRLDFAAPVDEVARYNPLDWVVEGEGEVAEVQAIADHLLPEEGAAGASFWRERAHELLVAVMLHELYRSPRPTLGRCRELLRSAPVGEILAEMALTAHDPTSSRGWRTAEGVPSATHPEVSGCARSLLGLVAETRSGVWANAERALRIFADPRVLEATERSDFVAEDLMDRDRPVSLYLTVPAGDLERLAPILRLFVGQLVRALLSREVAHVGATPFRHRLLLLLDEFPLFGRLRFLEKAGAALRGYGIQLLVIVQSMSQLRGIYGAHESISGICPIHVTLGATDLPTAELISRRIGRRTVQTERASVRMTGPGRTTLTEGDHARFLLEPDEVARLPEDRLLVLAMGHPAILAERRRYFEDPEMRERTEIEPPRCSVRFRTERRWSETEAVLPTAEEIDRFLAHWERGRRLSGRRRKARAVEP